MILKKAQLFLKADPDFELREATADDRPFIVETLGKSFGNTDEEADRSIKRLNLTTGLRLLVSQAANRSASSVLSRFRYTSEHPCVRGSSGSPR